MWKHIAANGLTLIIVALFLAVGAFNWATREYSDAGPLAAPICLQVDSGATLSAVTRRLDAQGAISSPFVFETGADYQGKAGLLKAGRYLIPAGASMEQIVDTITASGRSTCGTEVVYRIGVTQLEAQVREVDVETSRFEEVAAFDPLTEEPPAAYTDVRAATDTLYRVVVAEGTTSWQVAFSLGEIEILEADITETPPEGMLAPGSYEVSPGDTASSVVARMTAAQERILADAWANRVEGIPLNSPEEVLIMASIIEKETAVADERRKVASVFENRLNQGMRLQTDPTVIYGITRGEGVLGRGLRRSELDTPTPWNTYAIDGLPPTPIANPGRASIEAAVNPDETPYIFFVADGTGGHAFATTLAEHNRNVARWREIEAERNSGN